MSGPTDPIARKKDRANWPIVCFRVGEEPGDDLSATTTAAERVAMMWPLAVEAWSAAGRQMPEYRREGIPGRLFRPGDKRPDDEA